MKRSSRYPRLETRLPPHLLARLDAASTILKRPVDELVAEALELHLGQLEEDKRELIDRVAASLLTRTELESED